MREKSKEKSKLSSRADKIIFSQKFGEFLLQSPVSLVRVFGGMH